MLYTTPPDARIFFRSFYRSLAFFCKFQRHNKRKDSCNHESSETRNEIALSAGPARVSQRTREKRSGGHAAVAVGTLGNPLHLLPTIFPWKRSYGPRFPLDRRCASLLLMFFFLDSCEPSLRRRGHVCVCHDAMKDHFSVEITFFAFLLHFWLTRRVYNLWVMGLAKTCNIYRKRVVG